MDDLIGKVSSMADVLKKLKYTIDRKSLETIYFTFIRPKLEYACLVWDNCSGKDSDLLDSFQMDMARIVCGARKGTSHKAIFDELGWESLSDHRLTIKDKQFENLPRLPRIIFMSYCQVQLVSIPNVTLEMQMI